MSIETHISDSLTGEHVAIKDVYLPEALNRFSLNCLTTVGPFDFIAQFKAVQRSSAGTSVVAEAPLNGGLIITDLVLTADRVNGATTTLTLTDGTNSVNIFGPAVLTDAPITFSANFGGRVRGWRDARLDLITTGAVSCAVTVGYVKTPTALNYAAWDELR